MPATGHLMIALMAIGILSPDSESPVPARRFIAAIGDCKVTALSSQRLASNGRLDHVIGPRSANAFLVERGGASVLIAPIALSAADRVSLESRRTRDAKIGPDAVVLTSLEERQSKALMDGADRAFPNSMVFVDRAILDYAHERGISQGGSDAAIAAYLTRGRLRAIDPDTEVLPGVKIAISPYRARMESRVRVKCGSTTLVLLPGREVAFHATEGADARRDERLPRVLASDGYVVALTDGAFPGIGSVYVEHDGYHWGPIAARSMNGALRRRGEVFVEPGDTQVESGVGGKTEVAAPCEGPEGCPSAATPGGTPKRAAQRIP